MLIPVLCSLTWCYLDVIVFIESEAMVDPLWQHDHVSLLALNPNPLVILPSDIKVACCWNCECQYKDSGTGDHKHM